MRQKIGLIVLLLLVFGTLGVLVERALVSDEEELEAMFDALIQALADEDHAAMDALLLDPFNFSGPPPIKAGDRPAVLERLDDFWEITSETRVSVKREVTVEGSVGVVKATGHVRFEWSDGMVLYKVIVDVPAIKTPDGWKAQKVTVVELTPGLF